MRYTTARFGDVANLFGEFAQGRPFTSASGINIELYESPNFTTAVPLTFSGCREISGSRAGGFATYFWPSSGITTPVSGAAMNTEYLYVMRDTQTSRIHKGKFVLGGHPDESAHTRRHITNRRRVISGLNPWLERVYEDDASTTLQDARLRDLSGGNITDTNSPASGILIAERDPV